jgi:hypothetical protein
MDSDPNSKPQFEGGAAGTVEIADLLHRVENCYHLRKENTP